MLALLVFIVNRHRSLGSSATVSSAPSAERGLEAPPGYREDECGEMFVGELEQLAATLALGRVGDQSSERAVNRVGHPHPRGSSDACRGKQRGPGTPQRVLG